MSASGASDPLTPKPARTRSQIGKANRAKGARRELALVEMHKTLGVHAERVPLSGAMRYQGGGHDIDVYLKGRDAPPWIGEVKARATASGSGFAIIERWLADYDFLALWADREKPLIVLPWERWQDLLLTLQKR